MNTNFSFLQKVEKCWTFWTGHSYYYFSSFLLIEKEINTSNIKKSRKSPKQSTVKINWTNKLFISPKSPASPGNFRILSNFIQSYGIQYFIRLFSNLKNFSGLCVINSYSISPIDSPEKSPKQSPKN